MRDAPATGGVDEESLLIDRVLEGDDTAFRTVYRTHAPTLYRLALRMSGGREAAAEDVVQESWSRALRSLSGFERRSSLVAWLSGIVVRCSLERIRRDRYDGEAVPASGSRESLVRDRAEERVDLERAFESLPAGYRSVLVLHDIEGYTHEDIAALLGITPGTSKSQLSRARAWMRRALGFDYASE